jgi:hypothetical protein
MLEFARKSNPFPDVLFVHEDAAKLDEFGDKSFDYATMLMLMHELPRSRHSSILKEALRVARKVIIIDWIAPLPKNAGGLGLSIVERTIGYDHYPNFRAYLAAGGIRSMLQEFGMPIRVESSSVFWHNCREVFVVSKPQ